MSTENACSALLRRIQKARLRQAPSNMFGAMIKEAGMVGLIFIVLVLGRCPNKIYNAWKGPFPMNLTQFRDHIRVNYEPMDFLTRLKLHLSLFRPEYVQLQLGEDIFTHCRCKPFTVSEGDALSGKTAYTMHTILNSTLPGFNETISVRFLADEQAQYKIRVPYHFESFEPDTFRCLVRQLDLSPDVFNTWLEQSIHVEKIQQIYAADSERFNAKVMKKCGIILGSFLRPPNERPLLSYEEEYQNSRSHLLQFDTSPLFSVYTDYMMIIIFIVSIISWFENVYHAVQAARQLPHSLIPPSLKRQMDEMEIVSLEQFDHLLSNTTYEDNYQDRLFIVLDKYLIASYIDFDEQSEKRLQEFFIHSPVISVPLDQISEVRSDRIAYRNNNADYLISFPTNVTSINFDPAPWLHKRAAALSDRYRDHWEQNKEAFARRDQQERLLQRVIEEETQYQQYHYRNRIRRFLSHAIPASPRFIAEFRLAGWKVVTSELHGTTCGICLEDLRLNHFYNQWPCPAKHTFHYDCMLEVLRTAHKCPFCRHPVQAATFSTAEALFYNWYNIFNLVMRRDLQNPAH